MNKSLAEVYQPKDFKEAQQLAAIFANTEVVPKDFRKKPDHVLVAMIAGAEVGLSAFQSLQGIAVINGRATFFGDALLAVIMNHPDFEYIKETVTDDWVATCKFKRKGRPERVVTFSINDAKRADLWGRGVWAKYPKRMLKMRARSYALRDECPDILRGLAIREEVEDYQPIKNVTPESESPAVIEGVVVEEAETTDRAVEIISQDDYHALLPMIQQSGFSMEAICEALGVEALAQLPKSQMDECLDIIREKKA